ncbi:MAG: TIM barrel protein [Ardenticatenaceae bacterium]|nr:TIM barrel protein [Ardenticatenaceae bacterium]HBY98161.1 hydroxypyruvate isomerase [Chloroflexota bacterium]
MTLHYAPNLTMLYTEVPLLARFARAAASGFTAVEVQFPYEAGIENVKGRLDETGLRLVLFNLPPGDTAAGELGTLSNPARRDYFRQSFETALTAAVHLNCTQLNTLFGQKVPELDPAAQIECAVENLAWAVPLAAQAGVTLLLEPLNFVDWPHFFLHHTATAVEVVTAVGQPQVKVQYDVYHAQMAEGNLINTITTFFPHIGHIQIADVPGRHEPGTGEINYPAIFAALEKLNYSGYIGLEYKPSSTTEASLDWLPREARQSRPE